VGSCVTGTRDGKRVVGRFVGNCVTGARDGTRVASEGRLVMGGAEEEETSTVGDGEVDTVGSVVGPSSSKTTTGTSTAAMTQATTIAATYVHRFHGKAVSVSGGETGRHQ
jgi:hypothetical protein